MANSCVWYFTDIPSDIVEILSKDIEKFESEFLDSKIYNSQTTDLQLYKKYRSSRNTWIPTSHWIGGFLWHYVQLANRDNFLYDLTCIDNETIQYTEYKTGDFYNWHADSIINYHYKPKNIKSSDKDCGKDFLMINSEYVRKLSFVLQLTDETEYTGGELQLIDVFGMNIFAPKKKGTMILFDSRLSHRVRKVKSGTRKSLVGWVIGPRWK